MSNIQDALAFARLATTDAQQRCTVWERRYPIDKVVELLRLGPWDTAYDASERVPDDYADAYEVAYDAEAARLIATLLRNTPELLSRKPHKSRR